MQTKADFRKTSPIVIVLASGRGERFVAAGGTGSKLRALLAGKPVLERTLDAVRASGLAWHVEGAGHPGMGDSIAAAVRATRDAPGWLILPGDLPLVRAATLRAVAAALDGRVNAVQPNYRGERGHPVGFAAGCGPQLAALEGNLGASSVLRSMRAIDSVADLAVDDAGVVTDIDTPAALAQAEALWLSREAGRGD
jgi:molybdenum cofactor cytidylyltransferase